MSVQLTTGDLFMAIAMIGALILHSMQFARWAGKIDERVKGIEGRLDRAGIK